MKQSREKPKGLTIPAQDAAEIDRLAQVAREATLAAQAAQLRQEAAYLKAVLRAAEIDPNALEVAEQPDGSVVLTRKES